MESAASLSHGQLNSHSQIVVLPPSSCFTSDVQGYKKVVAAEWSVEAQLRPRSPGYQTRGDSKRPRLAALAKNVANNEVDGIKR